MIATQGVYKSSLTNFHEISRTHLTKFQQDKFFIGRASEVLQHGIQTHALSVMYDIIRVRTIV